MKKTLALLFFGTLCPALAAQTPTATPPAPPDLVVLQKKWQTHVRNPALDQDPFLANDEFAVAQEAQKLNDMRNRSRARGGESPEPTPRVRKGTPPPLGQVTTYVYRARVRNTGAKTVRVVEWGYTFLDPETQEEVGHHLYTTKIKIRPGQENELVGRSAKPQTATVNVKSAGKELGEQVVIYRVEYEDGSVWQPSQN
ncbi:MAG TPA: hypothetical protein VF570_03375 [Pyrinomonadaceae bacterium]|jgi:hypothetical protein